MRTETLRASVNAFSYDFRMTANFLDTLKKLTHNKKVVFACIGTDRATGDSLGPLVGTKLKKLGYTVVGTLEEPLHAKNLASYRDYFTNELKPDQLIAIDACLGELESIGDIILENIPLKPGSGVKKDLQSIGDISIMGVVNLGGYLEHQVLQSTRLHTVITMADNITYLIWRALQQNGSSGWKR